MMMVWLVLIIVFLVTSGVKNICHSNCETCSGPNINECLTCKTGLRLSQGACCQPGNFYLQALTSCQSCHPTCANCNSASMSDCTDCPPNRNILPTKQCVCKEGTYDSGTTCSPCDTSCYTCSASGPNSCTGCKELAVLDLTTKSCKCRDGTYLDATTNSCAKCDISCKTCAGPGRSQCNSCGLLATFSPSGATGFCSCTSESYGPSGNCITCDPTCMTCSGPSAQECLTCRVGMYKDLFGKCKCNPGTIQNANGGCDPCHGSCLECINPSSTGCISCALDRQPQNGLPGACVCRTQTVEILPDLVCQKCHYSCKTCSGLSSSNCLSCGLNSLLSQSTCLSSNLAMFFDTQADSQPCHPSCQACQGPSSTHCTACRSSASFISSATQINSVTVGTCTCPPAKFIASGGVCAACHPSCARCTSALASACTSCVAGTTLSSSGECLCPAGQFFDSQTTTCSACHPTCQTCSAATPTSCLSCRASFLRTTDSTCVCESGLTLSGSSCISLPSSIPACALGSTSACYRCIPNAILTSASTCLCLPGLFFDSATGSCSPCSAKCKTCGATADECTQCRDGLVLDHSVRRGHCRCPNTQTYPDPLSATCRACSPTCKDCVSGSECTNCKPFALLTRSPPTAATGTCGCSGANERLNVLTGQCEFVPCAVPLCAVCESATQCATCVANAVLDYVTKLCSCPSTGYYSTGTECAPCHLSCIQCTGPTQNDCIACQSSSSIVGGTSIGQCIPPTRSTFSPTTGSVVPCHPRCDSCTGMYERDCITCRTPISLPPGSVPLQMQSNGICDCPTGYFYDGTTQACLLCYASCKSCTGPSASDCIECTDNMYLSSSKTCIPLPGFFKKPDNLAGSCDQKCLTCNGPNSNNCLTCNAGASRSAGSCLCSGLFKLSATGFCYGCASRCMSCNSYSDNSMNTCASCVSPFTLTNKHTCEPSAGKYIETTTGFTTLSSCQGRCQKCSITPYLCTECLTGSGLMIIPSISRCLSPPNNLFDEISQVCYPCPQIYNGCFYDGFVYTGLGCKIPTISNGVVANLVSGDCICRSGYYMDAQYQCAPCHPTCKTCSGPDSNQCKSCFSGMNFNGFSCTCPANTPVLMQMSNMALCGETNCALNCHLCDSPTLPSYCSGHVCQALQTNCQCPSGQTLLKEGVCVPCAPTCTLCSRGDPQACTACVANAEGPSCTCKKGYSSFSNPSVCEPCFSTCGSCRGKAYTTCLTCLDSTQTPYRGVCPCPPGQFMDQDAELCKPCDPTCLTCDQFSDMCTSCRQGAFLSAGVCVCTQDSGNCGGPTCHYSCRTCFGTSNNQCISCKGIAFMHDKTCICPERYYMTPDGLCTPCPSDCFTCNSLGQCTSCKTSEARFDGGRCICSNPFDSLSQDGICQRAPLCDPSCLRCRGPTPTDCTACAEGIPSNGACSCPSTKYYFDERQICRPCDVTCQTCRGPTALDCLTCPTNSIFQSSTPNSIFGSCTVPLGKVMGLSGYIYPCHASCKTCSDISPRGCLSCEPSLTLNSGRCVCPYGSQPSPTDPKLCIPISTSCHFSCLTCSGPLPTQCLTCIPSATLQSSACKCMTSFYMAPTGICAPCHSTCLECTGPSSSECTTCPASFILTSLGTCTCPPSQTLNTATDLCESFLCHSTCLTCATTPTQCTSCPPQSFLAPDSSCICQAGTYRDSSTTQCLPCHPSCLTCSGPLDTHCLTCRSSQYSTPDRKCMCPVGSLYSPTSNQCESLLCHPSCLTCRGTTLTDCLSCRPSFVLAPSGACLCPPTLFEYAGVCTVCHPSCLTCSGPLATHCLSCAAPRTLFPTTSTCDCPPAFFSDPSSTSTSPACLPCDPSCLTCSGPLPTNCLSCRPLQQLAPDSRCLCSAPSTYFDPSSLTCVSSTCHSTCLTCRGFASTDCVQCRPPATLTAVGTCVCPPGFTLLASSGTCTPIACHPSCLTCTSPLSDACLTCPANARLLTLPSGVCECIPGQYMSPQGQCLPCSSTCATCSADPVRCTTCRPGAILSSFSTCDCPPHSFFSAASSLCQSCHSTCDKCFGPQSQDCIGCRSSLATQISGYCVCPSGFAFDSAGQCTAIQCHSTCLTCTSPASSACTTCRQGEVLTLGSCLCQSGLPRTTTGQCPLCNPKCKTCKGTLPTDCLSCIAGAFPNPDSSCSCSPGSFFSVQDGACRPCAVQCATCNGATAANCLTCRGDPASVFLSAVGTCTCRTGFTMDASGVCRACAAGCVQCDAATLRCLQCVPGATLDSSTGRCMCESRTYLNTASGSCSPCSPACENCSGGTKSDCTSCSGNAVLTGSRCICPDGSVGSDMCKKCSLGYYFDRTTKVCMQCNKDLFCESCLDSTTCTSCMSGYVLTSINTCRRTYVEPSYTYDCSLQGNQILVSTSLKNSDSLSNSQYIRENINPDMLTLTDANGNTADYIAVTPVPQSEYEWEQGNMRFDYGYGQSSPSEDITVELTPLSNPSYYGSNHRGLQSTSSSGSKQVKMLHFPSFVVSSTSTVFAWRVIFSLIAVVIQVIPLYLIFLRPLASSNAPLSLHDSHSLQLYHTVTSTLLSGFCAVNYKGYLNQVLGEAGAAALLFGGLNLRIPLADSTTQQDVQNGFFLGKFTTYKQQPYLILSAILPSILIIFFVVLGRVRKDIRSTVHSCRVALVLTFLPQLSFLCILNLLSFFGTWKFTGLTVCGVLFAILVFGLLAWETFSLLPLVTQSVGRLHFFSTLSYNLVLAAFGRYSTVQIILLIFLSSVGSLPLIYLKPQEWKTQFIVKSTPFLFCICSLVFEVVPFEKNLDGLKVLIAITLSIYIISISLSIFVTLIKQFINIFNSSKSLLQQIKSSNPEIKDWQENSSSRTHLESPSFNSSEDSPPANPQDSTSLNSPVLIHGTRDKQ